MVVGISTLLKTFNTKATLTSKTPTNVSFKKWGKKKQKTSSKKIISTKLGNTRQCNNRLDYTNLWEL
jgi:hypothetical protein